MSHFVVITSPLSQSQLRYKLFFLYPSNCINRKLQTIIAVVVLHL